MKKLKIKPVKLIITLAILFLLGVLLYFIVGNPYVFINNKRLGYSVKSSEEKTVNLNEVIPFEWDVVYTFWPYTTKDAIEETIGFESSLIKENNINEGMVYLLFINDNQVVANVLGYENALGYNIDFTFKENQQITYDEKAEFIVTNNNDIVTLTYSE